MARAQFLGESALVDLPAPGPRAGGTIASGDRRARAYVTKGGKVALQLSHETVAAQTGAARSSRPRPGTATRCGSTLSGAPRSRGERRHPASGRRRRRGRAGPQRHGQAEPRAPPGRRAGRRLPATGVGRRGAATSGSPSARSVTVAQRAPYAVSAGPTGGLTVVRLRAGEAVPGPLTTPPADDGSAPPGAELPNAAGVLADAARPGAASGSRRAASLEGSPQVTEPVATTTDSAHPRPVVAVVLAGGVGTRIGADRPKQLLRIGGRTILEWAVARLRSTARASTRCWW